MKRLLTDISSARFGVNAKGLRKGPMALVQSSAILPDGIIEHAYIDRVHPELISFKEVDLLRKDDVLLIGKGSVNSAVIWPGSSEDTIASSMLYVIRPHAEVVLPAYLAAYLNSHSAKAQMTRSAKTGSVNVLSRKALDQLQVPVPSLDEQHKLVRLADAAQRAKRHLNELTNAYTQLLDAVWANYPNL